MLRLTWQNCPILGEILSPFSCLSKEITLQELASTALAAPHQLAPKQHRAPRCAAITPAPNRARNRAQLFSTSPFPSHDGCWLKHPLHFMHMLVTFCPAMLPLLLPLHSYLSVFCPYSSFPLYSVPASPSCYNSTSTSTSTLVAAAFCPSASFHFSQFCFIPLLFPSSTSASTFSTSGYASGLSSFSFHSFPLLLPLTLLFQSTSASISFCFISLPVAL